VAVFWPVVHHEFVNYDDPDYVTANAHVLRGLSWDNVVWALSASHAGNWHPLTWLSHMLDVQLFGFHPGWHHGVSVLFHAANTVLLFLLFRRMTGATWRSGCLAGLFALHPLHVESVAWAAERKDVLSAFFFLLTLLAYARFAECGAPKSSPPSAPRAKGFRGVRTWSFGARTCWYCAALLLFALGLMSKPMVVTLPCVLLLLDFWPLGRLGLKPRGFEAKALIAVLKEKLPFFGLALVCCILTFQAQQTAGYVRSLETSPLGFRMANALISYVRYAWMMVWPAKLAVFYPAPSAWPVGLTLGTALILGGLTGLALWQARKAPHLVMGWFWYLGMAAPVIGLVQVGQQALADRYTYLPLIGLFVAILWSLPELATAPKWARGSTALVLVSFLSACAILTCRQVAYWQNSGSLFQHALAVTRDNALAQNNLGSFLMERGNLTEAEIHFAEAVRIFPGFDEALVNLGLAREKQGRLAEASDCYERALRIRASALGHYNFGTLLLRQSDLQGAESHFRAALQLDPEFALAWHNLGVVQGRQGKTNEAEQAYTNALRFRPANADTHFSLGELLAGQRRWDEAIASFKMGLAAAPGDAEMHSHLAAAFAGKGEFEHALPHYREAARLNGGTPLYLNDLAWILATCPRSSVRNGAEAVRLAERAIHLGGANEPRFLATLDAAYAESGRFDEAVAAAKKTRELALAVGQQTAAQAAEQRLALYATRKPYHQPDPQK
jgi:protein O-mannosyl-transferase